jgi:Rha family phage regulatory protein
MKNLVHIKRKRVVTDSLTVAEKFEKKHDNVLRKIGNILRDDEEHLLNFAEMSYQDSYGRNQKKYLMDRRSFSILCMSFTGKKALKWKNRFYDAFESMEQALLQKSFQGRDAAWVAQRQAGKLTRKEETDIIQRFVEYATAQGSRNAEKYFCNLSKMENRSLFILEHQFDNLREILDLNQLAIVSVADGVVARALADGMRANLHYKDIYRLARKRVETLADIRGRTVIPASQAAKMLMKG